MNPSAERMSDTRPCHVQPRDVIAPLVGIFGCTEAVAVASVAVAVQLCPQAYPLGQQPPPLPSAQLYQPCAQLPVPKAEPVSELTTPKMTTPFELATVVKAEVGQEVKAQSRPTRQHPP
jgi:hypothetical protein